jgi:hypothetical protein
MVPMMKALFHFFLLGALLLSFYFFIDILVFGNMKYKNIFSTWQFPMLLAIYVDVVFQL